MNHNITWDWLAGLLETDGSILLFIDKSSKSFKFEFRLSNADINQNVIKEVQDFYLKFGINSTIDIGENAGDESKKLNNRASSLRIQGANQVQKFITLLRANVTNSFKGVGQVEWQGVFTYVMHKREQLTVEVLIYAFGFKNLTYNSPSNKLQFEIKVRKQDEVKKCLEFHQKYPLRTEYRNLELANIRELFRIRDNDEIYNIAQIEPLLIEIYRVSKIYQKAPPKNPPTIEEAIPLLRNWVSKCKKAKKFKEEVEAYLNPKK